MIQSIAGDYVTLTHLSQHGRQHAPGALVALSHEDAVLGLEQKTIRTPTDADKRAADDLAVEKTEPSVTTPAAPAQPSDSFGSVRQPTSLRGEEVSVTASKDLVDDVNASKRQSHPPQKK